MIIASWRSENWNENKGDLAMMEVIYNESTRKIIGATMGQTKEEKITNEEALRRFGESNNMTEVRREVADFHW